MPADSDLIKLYSTRILALAAEIPHTQRLQSPMATVKKRAPLCGSMVTVDLSLTDGRVSGFGQEVKACALGQAAASVVGAAIIGCTRADLESARDQLAAMLKSDGPPPEPPFRELEVLSPASAYKNRHGSIMLVLDASVEAVKQAEAAQCA